MKKTLIILALLASVVSAYAVEHSKDYYKQELKERGYLYGCNPVNMSITEPVRGGFNYAAMNGEIDIMELQVKAGLDVTSCGKNLPVIVMAKNQPEAFDFLIKNGYSVDSYLQGYSYLILAEHYKSPEIVQILIDNGVDVNKECKGYTPLNYAIKKKSAEMVEMLVKAGAKPNEKTKKLVAKTKVEEIKELLSDL